MSDDTTPSGDATEPAPDEPGSGDGWSTGKKVLAAAVVVAFVIAACVGALLAASGSEESSVGPHGSTTASTMAITH